MSRCPESRRKHAQAQLGREVGGRWCQDAVKLVQFSTWSLSVPGGASVCVQHKVDHTALGRAQALPGPALTAAPGLDEVLYLADDKGPRRLALRRAAGTGNST
ncbi:unnamed protein product [Symbiodinium natans]|uniref:Uncharacterized protein n=1 Tax=Symbiodinium natans TaxID=878477 RepID=A0A812T353_9DINO|nr:unnamed protein product [Symbiodinium natans]